MPDRFRDFPDEGAELNLAPIMNIMMILIPLLLASSSFVLVGGVNINSPAHHCPTGELTDSPQDEAPLPRLLVAISMDGFTISDIHRSLEFAESGMGQPLDECAWSTATDSESLPITVCNRTASEDRENVLSQLNFRGLYNRLVEIHNHPHWRHQWNDDNSIIAIIAEPEIPFDVIVRTMDVARNYLDFDVYSDDERFQMANLREISDDEGNTHMRLFPSPILMMPRAVAN